MSRIKAVFSYVRMELGCFAYYPFFIIRRMLLASQLIFLENWGIAQIFIHISVSLL
jgi:hypothetical protein